MPVKYPHMGTRESRIWEAYLGRYGVPEGRIEYDVHLGEGAEVKEDWPEWMRVMVKALSTKRADVVVEGTLSTTIIEVKRRAGLSAVGQVLGYEALMYKARGGWKPVELLVVCEYIEPDMVEVFEYYKVAVVVLGELPR